MSRLSRFMWRSSFFPRKLSFTREGKVVTLVSIGLGLAAVNTGNNLLYLVFGLSLSLIVTSGLLSEANLRGLVCGELGPIRPSAREPALTVLSVRCIRRRFPSFSIEAWPFFDDPSVRVEPARFLELRPGTTAAAACQLTFPRRGEVRVRGMVVSTSFPFSFFQKALVVPSEATVLVHPAVRAPRAQDVDPSAGGEDAPRPFPGRGFELFGVRDYREGDNPRHIAHRLSASRLTPVVREFEDQGVRRSWIAVVNVDDGRAGGEGRVEAAIEEAAGLALQRLEAGEEVGVASLGGAVDPGAGPAQAQRVLDFLATVPVLQMNPPGVDEQVRRMSVRPGAVPVLWVRP